MVPSVSVSIKLEAYVLRNAVDNVRSVPKMNGVILIRGGFE